MCDPDEISNLAMFLTSEYADYINGEIVRIDGGELIKNSGEFNFITNIPFYNKAVIEEFHALEPSRELCNMARKVADNEGADIKFYECNAENIPLPDNFFDNVIITYTMCTIPEVIKANKEILRVLKPNGKLLFCEHGLSPEQKVAKWQSRINFIWGKIAGGCNLNRDIPKLIRASGFEILDLEEMYLPNTPKIAGYNYWGTALKKS